MRIKCLFILLILTDNISLYSQANENVENVIPSSDTIKKISIAAVPIVNYNRSFGVMIGTMVRGFYKVNLKDTISPSSSTMMMGMFSTSKTFMGLGVQEFYLKEDKWRLKFAGGTGDVAFQFYETPSGLPPGNGQIFIDGIWIDYVTSVYFFNANLQRRVWDNLYVGAEASFSWTTTEFDIENPVTEETLTNESILHGLGYNLSYDSRNHINFPIKGWFIKYKNIFYRDIWGASSNFEQFEFAVNNFLDLFQNTKSILVSRIYAQIGTGDVPFQAESFIGREDLRGYSQGKYRGKQVYAVQCELRQNLYKKFGIIGFLGFGSAMESLNDIPDSELLHSIGFGVRYLLIEQEKVNIGFDIGFGKDDWSFAFRIGETFGR